MNKLKVALCISGHFRSDKTLQGIKNYILSNSNIECDIFIHTWDVRDRGGPVLQKDKIISEYQPKKYVIESQKQFNITSLMEKQNFNKRDINGLLSMFYKIEACNNLKKEYEVENNFTYDCVIRFRGDVELLDFIDFQNLDLNKLYIPLHGDYKGINDQFAFSNSKNMDIYSSTFSNIETYLKSNILLNPEFFTKETILRNNLEMVRPYIKYVIIWINGAVWDNETRFPPDIMKKSGFL